MHALERKMGSDLQILYLRPFWHPMRTAVRLRRIYSLTNQLGQLVTLQNADEEIGLRLDPNHNPLARYSKYLGRLYDYFRPVAKLRIVNATNLDWEKQVLEEIAKADVIIINLAPIDSSDAYESLKKERLPPWVSPIELLDFETAMRKTTAQISEHGTELGEGLLRELYYCKQENVLDKVIVLTTPSFYITLQEKAGKCSPIAQKTRFELAKLNGKSEPNTKITLIEEALGAFTEVFCIIQYTGYHDFQTWWYLYKALQKCLAFTPNTPFSFYPIGPQVPIDIPPVPVRLPPDGELKHIRYTPIQSLPWIPRYKVVELSEEEVRKVRPDLVNDPLRCQTCGNNSEFMFFFQYGLVPEFTAKKLIYMKCQCCSRRDSR